MNTPRTAAVLAEIYDTRGELSEKTAPEILVNELRQLETELAEVTKERDALKDELQHYVDEGLIIKEDEDGL